MRVTYPHMGYLTIPVRNMLENAGLEVVEAPPVTKKTVELGSLYSPEDACLPYKITLGNLLESIDCGADAFITICGPGKCRMGFYNAVQRIKLAEKNKTMLYTVNTDNLFHDIYHFLKTAAPQAGRLKILHNIALTVKKLKALDALNQAKNYYGSRSSGAARIIDIFNRGSRQIGACNCFSEVNHAKNIITGMLEAACSHSDKPVPRIALIGEFYVLLEPFVNYSIEDAFIQQGIEINKFVYTGDWVYANTLLKILGLYSEEKAQLNQAQPYLNYHVGGEGLKSVGTALQCARDGYDGIVHIYPFGCMPEIVAQYALKNVTRDYEIPLLSLSLDEHSSDVGMVTRVEAFADCVKRQCRKQ